MNNPDKRRVVVAFCVTAEYYGRPISDAVAHMFAHDVADLTSDDVVDALTALRRDPKRRTCPLPAEIRVYIQRGAGPASPEQMAARIAGAVSKFGKPHAARARAYVGEIAWGAVEDMGGWADLCTRLNAKDVGVFTAQARELCRAHIDRAPMADATKALLSPAAPARLQGMLGQIGAW